MRRKCRCQISSTEKEEIASRGQRVLDGLPGAGVWNCEKKQE
jgi:hypothetical protein